MYVLLLSALVLLAVRCIRESNVRVRIDSLRA
jgi:hypothetical protein